MARKLQLNVEYLLTMSASPKYDLHSHSTHSDGQLDVASLLERAVEKGVDVLAITDHDTVSGIFEAREYISANELPLKLIAGVEISTRWESFEIHIVGLNVDVENPDLASLLAEQQQKREVRAQEIGRRLEKNGITAAYDNARRHAGDAYVTRAHFARYLVEFGVAKSVQGVFKKYLGRGKIGYVPSNWCDIQTAVNAIQKAGGQAVVAHPGRYNMSNKWLRKLLDTFSGAGGDGLEVAQPQQAPSERQFLAALSREYALSCSQGSDFHGPTTWSDLGKNLYLPKDCQPVWQAWEC